MADELNSDNKVSTILPNTNNDNKIIENNQINQDIIPNETNVEQNTEILSQKDDDPQNSYDNNKNTKEDFNSKIISAFKKLKEETGYTNEELIELLMNIDNENDNMNQEEEETADSQISESDDFGEQDYGSAEYWENRYQICPDTFDWYQKWDSINHELNQIFAGDELVLNIGCGNSEMSAEMQRTTFKTVISIDISGVVINQMIEKYKDNKDLIWFEMDCMNLTFEDEYFDIVFDKGTFDAILCGKNSIRNIYTSMSEIWRVLKLGGLFIEITYGEPCNRLDLFKHSGLSWKLYEPIIIDNLNEPQNFEEENQESSNNHYIYIFQKLLNYEEEDLNDEDNTECNDDLNSDKNDMTNKEYEKKNL